MKKRWAIKIGVIAGITIVMAGVVIFTTVILNKKENVDFEQDFVDLTEVEKPPEKAVEDAETENDGTSNNSTTEPFYNDGILIVNKKHGLPASYAPGENAEAVGQLRSLIAAGQAAGVDLIYSWSGYRSYAAQKSLYDHYVAQDGVAAADTYSARPGFSEHQTGLTFDLKDSTGGLYRAGDQSYSPATDWVAQNAHRFGFIVRYFDAKQAITGYAGEPWHLRYLGVSIATAVFNSGLALEEYLGVDGGGYL
jgi:LAS superfamily LD-carboxypeptidase LdcB